MNTLNLSEDISRYNFPENQYVNETINKTQIFIHHTAGNSNPFLVYKDWESNVEKIATCVVVGGKPKKNDNFKDGEIVQGFSSKNWAYHLGLRESTFRNFNLPYKSLDKISIGIELCSWGQLTYKSGKFYTYANTIVDESEMIELTKAHRGFKYYHKYTDEQIISLEKLLRYWIDLYKIPKTYNPDIFDVTQRALKGEPGIYTHNSVRYDKVDIYPDDRLINMLKNL